MTTRLTKHTTAGRALGWAMAGTLMLMAMGCRDQPPPAAEQPQAKATPLAEVTPAPPPEPQAPIYAGPRAGDRLETDSGMRIEVLADGHGEAITREQRVVARYRLLDASGELIDESATDTPDVFDFDGAEPWVEALLLHHPGMQSRIEVPAALFSPRLRAMRNLSETDVLVLELTVLETLPTETDGTTTP